MIHYLFNYLVTRYEHLGDTVLGMTVTHLLMKRFPCIRVGPSTVCASSLVADKIELIVGFFFIVRKYVP